jgi:hypothetical protein
MRQLPKMPGWQISETRGEPITASDKQITPIGRVFQVRWPGGGFIRHRPVAIEVRQGDVLHRVLIPNTTQRITTTLMLTGLAIFVIGTTWMRRVNSQTRRRRVKS